MLRPQKEKMSDKYVGELTVLQLFKAKLKVQRVFIK